MAKGNSRRSKTNKPHSRPNPKNPRRPHNASKKACNKAMSRKSGRDRQVVVPESKIDLEMKQDYSIPNKMQISAEDLALFASLTSAPQQFETSRKLSQNFDNFKKEQCLEDPTKDPEIRAVYIKIGEMLSRYRNGKIPESFSVLPRVEQWEDLLRLTRPDKWTPHAMLKTVNIFVGAPESARTLHFFKYYLLPCVLREIAQKGKLSYQLYEALKKGLFRPALWFRGILFPFMRGEYQLTSRLGTRPDPEIVNKGTIKQAQILASVIMKKSIPNLHASAAILKSLQYPYNGPVGVIIKIFVDKKFALPLSVINALAAYFPRFAGDSNEKMPVLWFQTILSFAKSYKKYLSEGEKSELKVLVRRKFKHAALSKEIVKELVKEEDLVKSGPQGILEE